MAIIGKSGSGKSTLLHMLGGLDIPTEGEVYVEGKSIQGLKKDQLAVSAAGRSASSFRIIIWFRI